MTFNPTRLVQAQQTGRCAACGVLLTPDDVIEGTGLCFRCACGECEYDLPKRRRLMSLERES